MEIGNVETVELFKLPVYATEILDEYVLVKHGLELEQLRDEMIQGIIYKIKTYILAEEIDNRRKTVKFTYTMPASWWQHFKRDCFPNWLLRKFPAKHIEYHKTKTVIFRKYGTYPKANILFPDKVGTLVKYKSFIDEGL